jgi:hypothetical protein
MRSSIWSRTATDTWNPAGAVVMAAEESQALAMLRRRKEGAFKQLPDRLDLATTNVPIDEVEVDKLDALRS